MLRIAIQKSGRLSDSSIALLSECGITLLDGPKSRKLRSLATNFPLEVLFLRDDDIPRYVEDGIADLGIVGSNVLAEQESASRHYLELGFAKCRLSVAVPRGSAISEIEDLRGKKIATSYPTILSAFLESHKIKAHVQEISGSVEVAPSVGLADAICDLVGSGSTLVMNGLTELVEVKKCQAMLVGAPKLDSQKQALVNKFVFRVETVLNAVGMKYVVLNAPNNALPTIEALLPGIKSPTIVPLAEEGWSAVHSLVHEDDFWDILENLKKAGAQGVVVVPVEKIIK
jgi:ATP phosphoribosyltransferase